MNSELYAIKASFLGIVGWLVLVVLVADLDLLLLWLALLLLLGDGRLPDLLGLALADNVVDVLILLQRLSSKRCT